MKHPPQVSALPSWPLLVLCFALGALALPLWDHASAWTIFALLLALGWRVFINFRAIHLLPGWLKLLILGVGCTGIYLDQGTLMDVDAAFGVLLILVGLKVCEANHARDLQVLTLLGCFLGLCDVFFDQELGRWLYIGLALLLVFAARLFFHQSHAPRAFRRSLWTASCILAQAVPLTAVLFFFFPRIYGDFRFILRSQKSGVTGLSERLAPGNIASLAMRSDVAFRVSFPDKNMPPAPQLYWRGLVLWDGNGLNWERGGHSRQEPRVNGLGGTPIRQHIMLKPYGDTWLFALDRPSSSILHASYVAGGALRYQRQIYTDISYDVESRLENHQIQIAPDELAAATRVPTRVSPAVQELANSWRTAAATDEIIVNRAIYYFRTGGYSYSLSPGAYSSPELDEFLFRRKIGFCEHYASAMASVLRLAGLPTRVVLGYQGGEYNQVAHYLIVRQSDAHAWCEVWLRGKGWIRVDPTSVIAPERVSAGLQSYMDGSSQSSPASSNQSSIANAWRQLERYGRLYWDNLSYQWNLRVLSFDRESQLSFLAILGVLDWSTGSQILGLFLIASLLLGTIWLWLRRSPGAQADAAQVIYARHLRRLSHAGLRRRPSEGYLHFAQRAASYFPEQADVLQQIGLLYSEARFASYKGDLPRLREAILTFANSSSTQSRLERR